MKLSRTVTAGAALSLVVGVLLVGFFLAGWSDVRAQQRAVLAAPARDAELRGAALAHALRAELARVITRESERPYFHYQNLFHDPRVGDIRAVAPSPLAALPAEPIVLGYFQIDAAGRTTTPTVNDDEPSLSEQSALAGNQRFRADVATHLAGVLAAPQTPVVVAAADPVPVPSDDRGATTRTRPPVVASVDPRPAPSAQVPAEPSPTIVASNDPPQQIQQLIQIDPSSYVQNNMPTEIYREQNSPQSRSRVAPQQRSVKATRGKGSSSSNEDELQQQQQSIGERPDPAPPPPLPEAPAHPPSSPVAVLPSEQRRQEEETAQEAAAPAVVDTTVTEPTKPRKRGRRKPPPVEPVAEVPAAPITITISPLELSTHSFRGEPTLVALRHVETPDGTLAQGFVIDRTALARWVDGRATDLDAALRPGDEAGATAIAPGWHLEVAPAPLAMTTATTAASELVREFTWRFAGLAALAMLAAAFVVWLVARAEQLARERSSFAAAAAHELRTPLAGLQLYGDMLADDLGDPNKLRDYARRMSEEAARLGRVVSNVLGFSQLERGNLAIDVREASLGDALQELATRAEPALDRAGAMLALDIPPNITARFDRDALARIVGNLVDNAEKYSRGAEDRTIELAVRAADNGAAEISVSDHGPGITAAARTRLFRPFSRGVTSDGPAGLGLGLALSRSLARAMGGDLEHRPTATGTTFVLRLPAKV